MVNASFSNEFFVGSTFMDGSSFYHNDVISLLYGLKSVSDDDDGSSVKKSIQSFGDLFF